MACVALLASVVLIDCSEQLALTHEEQAANEETNNPKPKYSAI